MITFMNNNVILKNNVNNSSILNQTKIIRSRAVNFILLFYFISSIFLMNVFYSLHLKLNAISNYKFKLTKNITELCLTKAIFLLVKFKIFTIVSGRI